MAGKGFPKQPAAIAKIKGTFRDDRYAEPVLKSEGNVVTKINIPYPPEDMSKSACIFWNRFIFDMVNVEGWLMKTDLAAFADLCEMYAEAKRLKCSWMKSPFKELIYDDKGNPKTNPTYKAWQDTERIKMAMNQRFGLDASSRNLIRLAQNETKEDEEFPL